LEILSVVSERFELLVLHEAIVEVDSHADLAVADCEEDAFMEAEVDDGVGGVVRDLLEEVEPAVDPDEHDDVLVRADEQCVSPGVPPDAVRRDELWVVVDFEHFDQSEVFVKSQGSDAWKGGCSSLVAFLSHAACDEEHVLFE